MNEDLRTVGMFSPDEIMRARRIVADLMNTLSGERAWTNVFDRIAVYTAVDKQTTSLMQSGENDEDAIKQKVLLSICRQSRDSQQ